MSKTPKKGPNNPPADPIQKKEPDFQFSQLEIENCIFEIRFPFAPKIVLNEYEFWNELSSLHPGNYNFDNSDQARIAVIDNKKQIDMIGDKLTVSEFFPGKEIGKTFEFIKLVLQLAEKHFEIKILNRVGLRLIYTKSFDNGADLRAALNKLKIFNFPDEVLRKKRGKWIAPSITFGWNNDEIGINYRIRGERRNVDLSFPIWLLAKGAEVTKVKPYHDTVGLFDVDTFIKNPIPFDKLPLLDWLRQSLLTSELDGKILLEEK